MARDSRTRPSTRPAQIPGLCSTFAHLAPPSFTPSARFKHVFILPARGFFDWVQACLPDNAEDCTTLSLAESSIQIVGSARQSAGTGVDARWSPRSLRLRCVWHARRVRGARSSLRPRRTFEGKGGALLWWLCVGGLWDERLSPRCARLLSWRRSSWWRRRQSSARATAGPVLNSRALQRVLLSEKLPTLTQLPVTATSHPFNECSTTKPIKFTKYGYVEREYLMSGEANVYGWVAAARLQHAGTAQRPLHDPDPRPPTGQHA